MRYEMGTVDQIPDSDARCFIREQVARIDRETERYCRMREEARPRIDAMLTRARQEWDERDKRDQAAERRRTRWGTLAFLDLPLVISVIGLTLSAIGLVLAVLVVAHVLG